MAEIQTIFDRQNDNGGHFWSRTDGDIHAPFGYSTIDTLFVLGEIGLSVNENPIIAKAVDFVFAYQTQNGSFKYSPSSSKLPCMTARIIAAFNRLGVVDSRMEKSFQWMLDTQWSDGGWRCPTVKSGKSPLTDAANPGTTLYVLDAFRYRDNNPGEEEKLNQGVGFLLRHWEVRLPTGPCHFGIGSRFFQIEYPFLRYNIFYYVYVLSFYKAAVNDDRFLEAYQILAGKIKNGRLIPENPHKAWQHFDFKTGSQGSDVATERWNEIEANMRNKQ